MDRAWHYLQRLSTLRGKETIECVPIIQDVPFLHRRDEEDVLELTHEVKSDVGAEDGIVFQVAVAVVGLHTSGGLCFRPSPPVLHSYLDSLHHST